MLLCTLNHECTLLRAMENCTIAPRMSRSIAAMLRGHERDLGTALYEIGIDPASSVQIASFIQAARAAPPKRCRGCRPRDVTNQAK